MRLQIKFWLDDTIEEQADLLSYIDSLKKARSFATVLRKALALWRSLKSGETDMLHELFPHTKPQQKHIDTSDLAAKVVAALTPSATASSGGLARLKPFSEPKALDVELDVKATTRSADSNATYNFLISSALNVYGTISGLPPEVIEYGIRTKKIPESMLKDVKTKQAPKGIKKIDNSGEALAVPDFEDMEL